VTSRPNQTTKPVGLFNWKERWKRKMRDKLIHDYFGVDLNTAWDTIQEDLFPLKEAVENLLHDLT
jgi:uncharacterized protein with HEPN domain